MRKVCTVPVRGWRGNSFPNANLVIWGVCHTAQRPTGCRPASSGLFRNEVDSLEAGIRVGVREGHVRVSEVVFQCFVMMSERRKDRSDAKPSARPQLPKMESREDQLTSSTATAI